MSFKKLFIGSAALLSVAACSKANDHKPSAGAVSAPAYDSKAQGVGTYTAGTPLYSFGVASKSLSWDGKIIDLNDRSMFVDANIASQVSALAAVDKVIQTKEQSLELWSAGNLLLAFDLRSGVPTMISMGSNFQITSASFVMNSSSDQKQGQALVSADLMLNMQDCAAEQKQEQGKQEQGKPEQKIANCHAVMMAFHLSEISESKQEQGKQEQGKQDQGKQGQDQGKAPVPTEPGKQGQDQGKQGQDQGKAPVPTEPGKQGQEQGKQGQDQGKAPVPTEPGKQGQEQGKQGQDQGKAPAPTEPGKQGQDQGKQGQDQGKAPAPTEPGKQGQEQGKQGK